MLAPYKLTIQMKRKYLIIFALLFFIQNIKSQSLTFGFKGMYGVNWMLNNRFTASDKTKFEDNFCNSGGLSVAWYFNSRSYYSSVIPGINLDILYATYNQKISGLDSEAVQGTKLNYLDFPLLFRITPEFGPYFEVGGQFSYLLNANGVYSSSRPNQILPPLNGDIKNRISKVNISGVVGSGVDIDLSDLISIMIGFRCAYGFTDITSPQNNLFKSYEPTHILSISGVVGIVYTLNYFH